MATFKSHPNEINKMENIVNEEMQGFLSEAFDYQKYLGKSIAKTNEMIEQAKQDDVYAIEPDGTWESQYMFDKVVLMNTRLRILYKENNGRGWEDKVDDVNLTQDRNMNFDETRGLLNWVRKAIKKGYTENRRADARQKSIEDREAQEYNNTQQNPMP